MKQGGIHVQALENRPTLNQWVSEYWIAFQLLGGSRTAHQGGVGPIPLSEIVSYMDCMYIRNVDDRLTFIKMIQSLDSVYVVHVNEQAAIRANQAKAQRGSQPRKR